ncbi:unnamed protein product [Closterium sp. NIES-64]|nr:unnamed protein product [Closterium sp. NIES-64]
MRTGNHVIETRAKQQQQQKQPNRSQTKVDGLVGTSRATVARPGEISSRTALGELEIVREEKRSLEKCLKLVVEERDALLELAARNAAVAKSAAGAKKEKDRAAVFESPPSPPRDSTAISDLGESLATADRAGKSGASVERALPRRSRALSAERVQRGGSGEGSFRRSAEGRPQSAERGPRRAGIADGEPAEWEGSGASALIALALEKERESTWEMEYRRELRGGEVMEGAEALRRERGEDDRAKAREWEAKRDFLREERKRQLAREMGKMGAVVAGEKRRIEEKRAAEIGRREQIPLQAEARREWSHGKPTESGERRRLLEKANAAKRESDRAERKERERTREMERVEQREREKERADERGKEMRREVERRREQERERMRQLELQKELEEEREQEQKREAEKEREWRKDKAQAEAWEKECERLSEEVERLHEALQQARGELAGVRRLSAGAAQSGAESTESELAKELEQTKLRLAKVEAERGQLASAVERMVLEMADAVREQEQFREALQHTSLDTMLLSHALVSGRLGR